MSTIRGASRALVLATTLFWGLTCLQILLPVSSDDSISCTAEGKTAGSCDTNTKSWTDEVGDKFQQFLHTKIFGQQEMKNADDPGFLSLFDTDNHSNHHTKAGEDNPFSKLFDRLSNLDASTKRSEPTRETEEVIGSLISRLKQLNDDDHSIIGLDFFDIICDALKNALGQLKDTFGEVLEQVDLSTTVAMAYYLTVEDAKKNPSWKRRQHRFYPKVTKEMVFQLHDALYLSQLSYVNSIDDFRQGLETFQDNEWELAYGTTDSLPNLPAHFLLIHKKLSALVDPATQFILPWEGKRESELMVTLVVRGTKHLSDAIADALLEPIEYRGGWAHGGILENGKNLAQKYLPKLESLLKHSGRDKVRLHLVGHSLGAGAASIAAMEFKEYDWIDVHALGFGCPSLLSTELSESTKDYVTTVVADADIIPRMSGASIANFLLDMIEFDWTKMALEDVEHTIDRAHENFYLGKILPNKDVVLEWFTEHVDRDVRPRFDKKMRERLPSILIPPGECVHFYRDGVGYSGVFTPCGFFSTVDLARTLVDDHLIMPGYHRALVNIVRDWENDYNFDFVHDIAAIPA